METYFDILPNELLYQIMHYIKNKYLINKFIASSRALSDIFNNDLIWREMLYTNIKNPVINTEHLWKDIYLDNLNIESKYNVNMINTGIIYDYIIFFRRIDRQRDELQEEIEELNNELPDAYVVSGHSVSFIVSSSDPAIRVTDNNSLQDFVYISNHIEKVLKLDLRGIIGFGPRNINIFDPSINVFHLKTSIDEYGLYPRIDNSNNIITFKINYLNPFNNFKVKDLNIILIDAPNLIL